MQLMFADMSMFYHITHIAFVFFISFFITYSMVVCFKVASNRISLFKISSIVQVHNDNVFFR